MALTSKEERQMTLHHYVAWVNFLWFAAIYLFVLRFVARYGIRNLGSFRAKANALLADAGKRPIILCSNHLTLVDSMIITWALCPMGLSLINFHRVPWHMPEFANFAKNIWLRIMCYLGKSIYAKRGGGSKARRHSMDQMNWLLANNHVFCLFPEGGRSRTGRVQTDSATYSVGELVQQHPEAKVLCLYLRGDEQDTWGKWPEFGTDIEGDIRELKITEIEEGRKGARDISLKIINELIAMEKDYFNRRAKQAPAMHPASSVIK